jgi:hypothetical protein
MTRGQTETLKRAFLKAFRACGNLSKAAEIAGPKLIRTQLYMMSRSNKYPRSSDGMIVTETSQGFIVCRDHTVLGRDERRSWRQVEVLRTASSGFFVWLCRCGTTRVEKQNAIVQSGRE